MARGLSERRTAPFECAALTRSSIHRKFWGCFAAQRGQAPSPQLAPTLLLHTHQIPMGKLNHSAL
ncbi:hypothetical protein B0D71_16030 [Pseudomonas laurylsulfativorans]|uniref:Uncharacterized protein n=1 Tax=Pseudomonas laurylsulfativorans TaxID=1943631 RepID=A0A2S3VPX4_9PSED|nr:hypothetical protein B0D71_16030 [Pseudomonas laurylsulfativorans]